MLSDVKKITFPKRYTEDDKLGNHILQLQSSELWLKWKLKKLKSIEVKLKQISGEGYEWFNKIDKITNFATT